MKSKTGKITRFMDMHSGGYLKTPFTHIYIDEPLREAVKTFKEMFKQDPDAVACTCCGGNFVYEEYDSLEEATAYDRNCKFDKESGDYDLNTAEISLEKYFSGNNKVIFITE